MRTVLLLVLIVGLCQAALDQDGDHGAPAPPLFHAHLHSAMLDRQFPAQTRTDWLRDVDRAFGHGSFTIALHGVMGAGKSRLAARMMGLNPNQIVGQRDAGGGFTTETRLHAGLTNNQRTESLFVIDTPGFGEKVVTAPGPGQSRYERQAIVLRGLDRAANLALDQSQADAPLKRIYFVVDCSLDRHMLPPESLKRNLLTMQSVYGKALADLLVFVVSKCDLLAAKGMQRAEFVEIRRRLSCIYQTVFQVALPRPEERVLFISTMLSANRGGSLRNLVDDLVRARNTATVALSVSEIMPALAQLEMDVVIIQSKIEQYTQREAELERSFKAKQAWAIGMEVVGGVAGSLTALGRLGRFAHLVEKFSIAWKAIRTVNSFTSTKVINRRTEVAKELWQSVASAVNMDDLGDVVSAKLVLLQCCQEMQMSIQATYAGAE